jgi:hypothetical protein
MSAVRLTMSKAAFSTFVGPGLTRAKAFLLHRWSGRSQAPHQVRGDGGF